jgi:aryl-alcohol dehydrogenase-like predicted oxidoreductase
MLWGGNGHPTGSSLTLGGGGIVIVQSSTGREEAAATVQEAVEADITFLDAAPSYGNMEGASPARVGH